MMKILVKMFYDSSIKFNNNNNKKSVLIYGVPLQIFLAIAVSLSCVSEGMSNGWATAVVDQMINTTSQNSTTQPTYSETSLIGTLPTYSSILMIPISIYSANHFSRKWTILFGSVLILISWICLLLSTTITTTNLIIIYIGISLRGMGAYIIYTITQIYIAETAQANIRGLLMSFETIFMDFGTLLSYICTVYVVIQDLIIIAIGIILLMIPLFMLAPKTPYYLLMSNKSEEAGKSLKKLRAHQIDNELEQIKQTVEKDFQHENESILNLLKDPVYKKIIITILLIQITQQMSGIEAILLYLKSIIENDSNNNNYLIYFGLMKLFSCLLFLVLIDRIGRRPLLIMSSLTTALALIALGIYFYLKDFLQFDFQNASSSISLIILLIYVLSYNLGLGPLTYILASEMLPTRFRAFGTSCVQVIYAISMITVIQLFAYIKDNYGFHLAFFILGLVTCAGSLYCCVFMVETKGKTLSELQTEFNT